jgi:hypothetical protein
MASGKKKKAAASGETQGPYRAGGGETDAGETDGLVGDLVRQFADPYAFFRELVQNAIDAGATEIHARVVLTREGEGLEARISVTDDGCGMSQEVVEEDLVVLFKSTKEERQGTIGKFGIGFVSVLAIAPTLVVVSTCTGEPQRHVLHLHPDRTYDLYREQGGARGTTVTLHVPVRDDGSELVARSEAALRRWCGHAGVPIRWTVVSATDAAPSVEVRIDGPLDIADALVSVHATSYDGATEALVALVPESGRLAAYYNRGLLLHESRDRGTRACISFKVVNPHLSHTLSREDVRLDEAHERAVALVQHTITVPLTRSVIEAIEEAANDHVAGDATAGARWLALVTASRAAELAIEERSIAVPLLCPVEGSSIGGGLGRPGPHLAASERDALVALLAERGVAVIDRRLARDEEAARTLDALLIAFGGSAPLAPHALHTALVPIASSARDASLLERVATLLGGVLRRPSSIVLVDAIGHDDRLSFVLSGPARQLATKRGDEADPFRLAMRPPLALRTSHPIVERARRHPDPVLAADVLARAVLIERGLASDARSASLLEASVRSLFASEAR